MGKDLIEFIPGHIMLSANDVIVNHDQHSATTNIKHMQTLCCNRRHDQKIE